MHIEDYLPQLNGDLEKYLNSHDVVVNIMSKYKKDLKAIEITVVYLDSVDFTMNAFYELGFSLYNRKICITLMDDTSTYRCLAFELTIDEAYDLLALLKLKGY